MNIREDLKAFVDNELPEERRIEVLKAIESDPALQAEVIEIRQVSRLVREEAWQPLPTGLESTLQALSKGRRKLPWFASPMVGWGLATVVFIAFFLKISSTPEFSKIASRFSASGESSDAVASAPGDAVGTASSQLSREKSVSPGEKTQKSDVFFDNQVNTGQKVSTAKSARVPERPMSPSPQMLGAPYADQVTHLELEVEDVPKAQVKAREIANDLRGKVESDEAYRLSDEETTANMRLQIPSNRVVDGLTRLRALGKKPAMASQGGLETPSTMKDEGGFKKESLALKTPSQEKLKQGAGATQPKVTINLNLRSAPQMVTHPSAPQERRADNSNEPRDRETGPIVGWPVVLGLAAFLVVWMVVRKKLRR
ncbi:MAG: hypothetical protein BGO01_03050 [Armatimonadetes bacterium 55-13]|nr:DUF4349 domain-containing protein [Armatimonadota bacterium]OJU63637.1 MAG: hypothetical protein BGO01_03050 [Armatimonadetes bacterium 55-13]